MPNKLPRFKLPDDWNPTENWCVQLLVPGDVQYVTMLAGWLDQLTYSALYDRDPTRAGAAAVSRRWQQALAAGPVVICVEGECSMDVRQSPSNPCSLEKTVGENWVEFANLALCTGEMTREAPLSPSPAIKTNEAAAAGFVAYVQDLLGSTITAYHADGPIVAAQVVNGKLGPYAATMPKTRETLLQHVSSRTQVAAEADVTATAWNDVFENVTTLWNDAWVRIDDQWQDWIEWLDEGADWVLECIEEGAKEGLIQWVEYGSMTAGKFGVSEAQGIDNLYGFIQTCVDFQAGAQSFYASRLEDGKTYVPNDAWGEHVSGLGWRTIWLYDVAANQHGTVFRIKIDLPQKVTFKYLGVFFNHVGPGGNMWVAVGDAGGGDGTYATQWNPVSLPVGTDLSRHASMSDLYGSRLSIVYSSWPDETQSAQLILKRLEIDYEGMKVFENTCNF